MQSLPEEPVRALSKDEVEAFRSDGVICVRQVLPARWIEVAAAAIERTKQTPSETGKVLSKPAPGYLNDIFMWLVDDGYRRFVFESPAARFAQQGMGSRTVTFFYDQVFVKEPGTNPPTPWHQDLTFWPIEGTQICSIWVPVDPVTRESSGLEYVRGSHRCNRRFKAVSPDYHPALLASNLEGPPGHRCAPCGLRFGQLGHGAGRRSAFPSTDPTRLAREFIAATAARVCHPVAG
jgi:ectoine hydroxylase-related dioxygenase (phytanoyl-CoA dioxygenase family)